MIRCVCLVAFASVGQYLAAASRVEVEQLIQAFGPIMRLDSSERYLMDDPSYILNSGRTALQWGLVHDEKDYGKFWIEGIRTAKIDSEAALAAVWRQAARDPRSARPDFRRWLYIDDRLVFGNQSRAKALVSVLDAPGDSRLDLQFWFFYPFNGPGKFHLTIGRVLDDHVKMDTCGRHYGDWEHVTLRLIRDAAASGLPWRLQDVYLSRHAFSKWLGGVSTLHFSGRHPVIYIARNSHAHYPSSGIQYYRRVWRRNFWIGTGNVDLEDWTDNGPVFDTSQPSHYQIVFSNIAGWGVAAPGWYRFPAPWGQYEKLKFSYGHIYTHQEVEWGPRGPAFHGADE
ncbi:MAG: Vps62-related protein [Bryobacteraceae bacterium]|jgi:hypothetical protein